MEIEVKKFIKKAKTYAKVKGLSFTYDAKSGKGSHGWIEVGGRGTTIIGSDKTIREGLYKAMCKQLEIDPKELEQY